jgi:hypothetical protein
MEDVCVEQKMRELIILFLVANSKNKVSVLHIQKEAFLLQEFDNDFKELLNFIPHYKGPFSRGIHETIVEPMFLINCWEYIKPNANDNLSGGYLKLTDKGKNEYLRIEEKIKEKKEDKFLHLLTATQILTQLYNKLNFKELLLLIYDTYSEFTKKSIVYYEIFSDKKKLSKNLFKKELISKERYMKLIGN